MHREKRNSKNKAKTKLAEYSYIYNLASSLILYGEYDNDFAKWFKQRINIASSFRESKQKIIIKEEAKYVLPATRERAETRALWLLNNIQDNVELEILVSWANDTTTVSPKNLVIGIVGLAIIGPTLGEIKRKRRLINIFVNEKLASKPAKLAQVVADSSNALLARALRKAEGKVEKMEPDMADWIYEDGEINIYSASSIELRKIKESLEQINIPFLDLGDKNINAIAVSPALNPDSLTSWKLSKIL